MSVTALVRHTVRPGLEALFIAAVVRRMRARRLDVHSLRLAALMQSHARAQRFCWLGEWESEAEYEARAREMSEDLAPYSASPPTRHFLTHVHLHDHIGEPLAAITCGVIQAAPGRAEAARTVLGRPTAASLESTPDLTLRALYQDVEDPGRFVVVRGWRSASGAQAWIRHRLGAVRADLADSSVTLEMYSGRVWIDPDPQAPPEIRIAPD